MRRVWVPLDGYLASRKGELIDLAMFHQPVREYELAFTDFKLEVIRTAEEALAKCYESLHFTWAQDAVGQGTHALRR
jgi:hypothetical protein